MATIRELLQQDLIIEELASTDKKGVIGEFSRLIASTGRVRDEGELLRVLFERESLGSTGIGGGVAIPHGKLPAITTMIVAFGRSSGGIDFASIDGSPAHLFFLLVTPEDQPGEHLRALARISRILKNPALREGLMTASGREELQRLIYEEDGKYPQPLPLQKR